MTGKWMIYGANGYTGRLAVRHARNHGLAPILAGRDARQIESLAREFGFEHRIFDLADPRKVAAGLDGVAAVLHCAGPFSATSRPMLAGCLRSQTDYLDITGVGFDVVPTDCLAAMLKRELPAATHLKLAFRSRYGKLSPGTARTMVEGAPQGGRIRREGRIISVPAAWKIETIAFTADAPGLAVSIPWGDVSTAFYSTGIPNIEVLAGASEQQIRKLKMPAPMRWLLGLAPVQAAIKAQIGKRVRGPTDEQRARDEVNLYGEAWDDEGHKVVLRMRTREGYALTAESAVEATRKILVGRPAPGAYTPSMAFGAEFVLELEGTRLNRISA